MMFMTFISIHYKPVSIQASVCCDGIGGQTFASGVERLAGSIPVRGAPVGQVVKLVNTRHSECRAARFESSNLSLATFLQTGWRSADSHKVGQFGSIPKSAIDGSIEYANWKSGHVENVAILWVRPPSRSLTGRQPDTVCRGRSAKFARCNSHKGSNPLPSAYSSLLLTQAYCRKAKPRDSG